MLNRIRDMLNRRHREKLTIKFGGTQTCPYCLQCAQDGKDWNFSQYERDPMLDVLTCGVCGGLSLWRFEVGMFYIGPHTPPPAHHKPVDFYDFVNAKLKPDYATQPSQQA